MKRLKKKSPIVKRGLFFAGHKISVSLEDAFWNAIHEIAAKRGVKVGELVSTIDNNRRHENLSSAIRLFVLCHYRALAERRAARPRKGRPDDRTALTHKRKPAG
jgi:predicted DNA-binding ribbon-helix-helix protein